MQPSYYKDIPSNSVITDKHTYSKYVAAGLWVPQEDNVKFFKHKIGVIKCNMKMKTRKNEPVEFQLRNIYIEDYFL